MFRELRTYTSLSYKIWMYLVIPIICIALMNLIALVGFSPIMLCSVLITSEILFDSFAFSGICKKHGSATNLIRSSHKGERFMKNLIVSDLAVKMVKTVIIYLLGAYAMSIIGLDKKEFTLGILLSLIGILVGLLIDRHLSMLQACILVGVIDAAVTNWIYMALVKYCSEYLVLLIIIAAVLVTALAVGSYLYIMNAYKKSFVD